MMYYIFKITKVPLIKTNIKPGDKTKVIANSEEEARKRLFRIGCYHLRSFWKNAKGYFFDRFLHQ